MSEGFHAKMSLLARRKLTSVFSYLEESAVPMRTTLPSGLSGSMRTSLEPSVGSKDPVDFLGSGTSSVTLLTIGDYYYSHDKMVKGNGDRAGIWYGYWWV